MKTLKLNDREFYEAKMAIRDYIQTLNVSIKSLEDEDPVPEGHIEDLQEKIETVENILEKMELA